MAFLLVSLVDSCRADARRWIPAFAGMTNLEVAFFLHKTPFIQE
jgi:hypothetical protein